MAACSLWLVPDRAGPTFARLSRLIQALAARRGGDVFDPHVTLLGSLAGEPPDFAERARSLAAGLALYEIVLGEVVARPLSPNRYRRLFADVEPTGPLKAAHDAARAAFGVRDGEPYAPHLSLAYAKASPAAFEALRSQAVGAGVVGTRFALGALEVWRTDGSVADWRLALALPLGRQRA